MLMQTSIREIRTGTVKRGSHYLVACMAYYPRGMNKTLIDEFRNNLAPDRVLFGEWKEAEERVGHEEAFRLVDYEARFQVTPEGMESLRRLTDLSRKQDVYLACQCELGERCHRELLLLTAKFRLGADISPLFKTYPVYEQRLTTRL